MPVFIDSDAQISFIPDTKADGMKNLVNFPCMPLTYLIKTYGQKCLSLNLNSLHGVFMYILDDDFCTDIVF